MPSSPPLTPLAAAALRVAPPPERVLEIECGDGDGALFLAREFPAARVRGVDRAEELVRAATARVGLDPEGRVAFKQGRPGALPYPDGFFDLVVQVDGRPAVGRDRPGPASRRPPDPRQLAARRRPRRARRPAPALAPGPPRDRAGGERRGRRRQLLCRPPASATMRLPPPTRLRAHGDRGDAADAAGQSGLGRRQDAEAAAGGRAGARRAPSRLPGAAHQGPRARRRAGAAGGRSGRGAGGDERRRAGRRRRRRDGGLGDAAGDHPRRARQRPRPGARDSRRPRAGRGDARSPATAAGSTSARPTASASSASSASASTPNATGSPTKSS